MLLLILSHFSYAESTAYFDCNTIPHCGLPGDGPYPNLVIGQVLGIAEQEQSTAVFRWARSQGYWAKLPDDAQAFHQKIQLIALEVPVGGELKSLSLLMGRKDFQASGIEKGDLLRFAAHPPLEPDLPGYINNPKDAYWELFGCMAILCKADDLACPSQYQPGAYTPQGQAVDPFSQQPLPGIAPIDPATYQRLQPRSL